MRRRTPRPRRRAAGRAPSLALTLVPSLTLSLALALATLWPALAAAEPPPPRQPPAAANALTLSLPKARSLALQAAIQGRTDVALSLTRQLLDQNAEDGAAHLARSTAFLNARNYGAAYKGGRLAFRHAETQDSKYQSARIAAMAAFAADQNMLAQYWMRRAGDFAATEVDRTKIEQQFRIIQAKTPWSFRFSAALAPSSNVNGGSEEAVDVIDYGDFYYVGRLSADSQALSGLIGQAGLRGTYRFSQGARHRSQIEAGLFARRVWLSDEAKAALRADPTAMSPAEVQDALSVTTLELGLRHAFTPGEGAPLMSVQGGVRQYWRGADPLYTALHTGLNLQHALTPKLTLSGGLGYEARRYDSGAEGTFHSASLGLSYTFANGNRLTGTLLGRHSDEAQPSYDNTALTGRLGLSLGQPVAGLQLSGGVGVSYADYPDFWLGTARPRQDETVFADLSAQLTQIEFAGFSPNLRLRRSVTSSNISRFDSAQWGVSLGISSNF